MKEPSNRAVYRILIVDDEPEIRRFLRAALRTHRHEVFEASNGAAALAAVNEHHPDLLILDLGLPDMDGVAVTRQVRAWSMVPIIILSVRNHESDKIEALDAGADDYLTKPFGMGELLARIRGVMRRVDRPEIVSVFEKDGLKVDLTRRLVTVDGGEVSLTPTEYELLRALVTQPGRVQTHRQLIHKVWGTAYEDESRLLRVNISNLRRKIEPHPDSPQYIQTELGVGYRFKAD